MKTFLGLSMAFFLCFGFLGFAEGQGEASSDNPGVVPDGKYSEAPMLRALVAQGELPPVDERLPDIPYVSPTLGEIGSYGGTIHTFGLGGGAWNDLNESPENHLTSLLRIDSDTFAITGKMARDYNLADDGKSATLYMRPGTKWSDGAPFTADDILFQFEDLHWHDDVSTWNYYGTGHGTAQAGVSRINKVDDYTVEFEMDVPFFSIELLWAQWQGGEWGMFQPKHYLKKWHIDYNENADALAAEEGFDGWAEALKHHFFWNPTTDIDKPTTVHWMFTDLTDSVKAWERNPYFYSVDEAGQQLPYIDKVISVPADKEIYNLKAISGEADLAGMFTSAADWTLFKENEQSGGYTVRPVPGQITSTGALFINQNHENPAIRKVLNDVRFRRALSISIDRDELNEVVYLGLGIPMAATSYPLNSYHKDEWNNAYIEFDPDEANRLLDEIGLTSRDKNGFRKGLDGNALELTMEYRSPHSLSADQLELIKAQWQLVGLDSRVIAQSGEMWGKRRSSLDHIMYVQDFEGVTEVAAVDFTRAIPSGASWKAWLKANAQIEAGTATLADFEGGVLPGEEPPADVQEYYGWNLQKSKIRFRSEAHHELNQKIWDYWADQVYVIGTIGLLPQPVIAKNGLSNTPQRYAITGGWAGDIFNDSSQLFWKE